MDCRFLFATFLDMLRTICVAVLLLLRPVRYACGAEFRTFACADPGVPENGYRRGERFDAGSSVAFECSEGFVLVGVRTLTCEYSEADEDWMWDGRVPECVPGSGGNEVSITACSKIPRSPAFAKLVRHIPKRLLTYRCWQGYKRTEQKRITLQCVANAWRGPPVECRHHLMKRAGVCADYGSIRNGIRILERGTNVGDTVLFRCNSGYDLLGNRELTCSSGGAWSGAWPECVQDTAVCGDPGIPAFGRRFVEGTTQGAQVNYTCADNFALIGSSNSTCLENGKWSHPPPKCTLVNCGSPSKPKCGTVQFDATSYKSIATYRCNQGYALEGSEEAFCSANGVWSNPPPVCRVVHCSDPLHPTHGRVTFIRPVMFGTVATFSCHAQHGRVGPSTRVCLANGQWSDQAPTCRQGVCDVLQGPDNGWVDYPSTEVGSTATYSCLYGYQMVGSRERMCQAGGWTGVQPTCRPIRCSMPTVPSNGAVSLSNSNLVFSEAKHMCNNGYLLLGIEKRTCQPSGIWTDSPPGCYLIRCPRLRFPHRGSISYSNQQYYLSEASYTCDRGYELKFGDQIRTCTDKRLWSGNEPCCVPISMFCEELRGIPNGRVAVTSRATGAVATYTCKSGYRLQGASQRTCRSNGNWSGEEPTCIMIMCGELTNPLFGVVNGTGDEVGDKAMYFCESGYRLVGGDRERFCLESGEWTGTAPTCQVLDCGPLSDPVNGGVSVTMTTVGSMATYSCNAGYNIIGENQRSCLSSGQWSGDPPTCQVLDCGSLSDPVNGGISVDTTTVGSVANYSCNAGYDVIGQSQRMCLTSGQWGGNPPTCQVRDCGPLVDPANGRVSVSMTTVGSMATYLCNAGYNLTGEGRQSCLTSGQWSDEPPTCQVVNCGTLSNPVNGTVEFMATVFGSTARYSCNPPYRRNGPESRICLQSGMWSGIEPFCEDPPSDSCVTLNSPRNGTVAFTDGTALNSVARFNCDPGYVVVGSGVLTCGPDGWSGTEPTCVVIKCRSLAEPQFGGITFSSIDRELGSTANYSCDPPAVLVGERVRTCLESGDWSGGAPVCEIPPGIQCPPLSDPTNGQVDVSSRNPGTIASYTCNSGFFVDGSIRRECQTNGQWSGDEPVCEPLMITCSALNFPVNGSIGYNSAPPYMVSTEAIYSCEMGFSLQGGHVRRVCSVSRQWSGTAPTCELIVDYCPTLAQPVSGSLDVPGRSIGSIARYSCSLGFVLMGTPTRQCEADGTWSGAAPTCESIQCPPLSNPTNGKVEVPSRDPGDIASYTCNSGFYIDGPVRRECTNGQWSANDPMCLPFPSTVTCPLLSAPTNGFIELLTTTPSSRATYTCFLGYVLQGDSERVCQPDGSWTGTEPSCEAINCGPLMDPANGQVMVSQNTTLGMTATYSCNAGYQLVGLSVGFRFCTMSGNWSEVDPTCEPVSCGFLGPPTNGVINTQDGFTFTARVFYSCLPGYSLVPQDAQFRVCQASGQWSGIEPRCESMVGTVDCGSLSNPADGQVTLLNTSTNQDSLALYTCNAGYMLNGEAIRQCQANGSWEGEAPQCMARMCPPLPQVANGIVVVSLRTVGSMASYFCKSGFTPLGFVRRVCEENGEWSGDNTLCVRPQEVTCPPLSPPTDGNTSFIPPQAPVGSQVTYSCDPGFVLQGPSSRLCQQNGMWTGGDPTCQIPQCPNPGAPMNGRRIGNSFAVGDPVLFICNDGFVLDGNPLATCRENATWSTPVPNCLQTSRRSRRGLQSCSGQFTDQFGRRCGCRSNQPHSCCRYRREWSQLSRTEKLRYISIVKTVSSYPKYRPLYNRIMELYSEAFDGVVLNTAAERSQFLPWHRYYLQLYEDLLRAVDPSITLPYWDWTTHPTYPLGSSVFNRVFGFGDSIDSETKCVSSGPFREGEFSIASSGNKECIRRKYDSSFLYNRQFFNQTLEIPAERFDEFHSTLQLLIHFNTRCSLGGTMCSSRAPNDPLYLLLLTRLDLLLDQWQSLDAERASVRYSTDFTPLAPTLGEARLRVRDYSSNSQLPFGTAVCYSPLPPLAPAAYTPV